MIAPCAHCSLLPAHTAHYSLLAAHCAPRTASCSLLTAHCALLTAHYTLLLVTVYYLKGACAALYRLRQRYEWSILMWHEAFTSLSADLLAQALDPNPNPNPNPSSSLA